MKTKHIIFALVSVLLSGNVSAQLAMGKWQTHFSYTSIEKIAQSENRIFALSNGALFSVNKNDESIECYSKLTGLNDNRIANIAYSTETAQLFIAYANGNIDVMTNKGIVNIPDLYIKQMSMSKAINDIMFHNRRAYLSTDFGILVVNLDKYEIADTYYIGANGAEVKVLNTTVFDNYIYAATKTALYRASVSSNLAYFENWEKMNGIPNENDIRKILKFGNYLVLHSAQDLYSLNTGGNYWELFQNIIACEKIFVSGDRLIVKTPSYAICTFDLNKNYTEIIFRDENSERFYPNVNAGIYEPAANRLWLGSEANGILTVVGNGTTSLTNMYKPSGPASNYSWSMTFTGKRLISVPGGGWGAQYFRNGDISILEDNKWTVISAKEINAHTGTEALDFMMIAIDPKDETRFFVTSYGTGLYEFKNNALVKQYTHHNSPFQSSAPDDPAHYTRTNGVIFDKEGNLFVTNSDAEKGIKILRTDGVWTGYPTRWAPTWGKILINDKNLNHKWILSQRYKTTMAMGILVYDDNGTLSNTSNHRQKFFQTFPNPDPDGSGSITPDEYYCMEQDKNGVIWIGTDKGPLLFHNPENAFNAEYNCSRVKIPRNDGTDFADYLLEKERIRSIAIDGGNRKWVGTASSGVYLLSANGQETLQHFTTQNSPLPSDYILSIAINPITGEVFFGTGSGLVSYQSDAVESAGKFNNVHAYPNPVRPNFRGMITITGLVTDTRVKITDINGNLIYETTSNGGIATWDGKNLYGKRVATGIYLAICITEDGSQNAITKIMVIN